MNKLTRLISWVLLASVAILLFLLSLKYDFSLIFSLAAQGNWGFVILNVLFFGLFILFIRFKRKATRLSSSIYLAFIIALFIEMYGFPLTMYIFMWILGFHRRIDCLWMLLWNIMGENLFVSIFLTLLLPISNLIILAGILLVVFGWRKIYKAEEQLVTTGIYSHVRHPQYLGFLLITLGMNVLWVTISTLLLWPVLAFLYYRLAKEEEKEMIEKFGEEYRRYKSNVPMFIPHLRSKTASLGKDKEK